MVFMKFRKQVFHNFEKNYILPKIYFLKNLFVIILALVLHKNNVLEITNMINFFPIIKRFDIRNSFAYRTFDWEGMCNKSLKRRSSSTECQ